MGTINMGTVAAMVREAGYPCAVEMTGGNVATILAGTIDAEGYCEVQAGPGVFLGEQQGEADTGEFFIGPDDQGVSDDFYSATGEDSERTLADEIIRRLTEPTFCHICGIAVEAGDPEVQEVRAAERYGSGWPVLVHRECYLNA